jgi:hypothetical protein
VSEGEPSVVVKQAPLAHETDARWYATIVMQACAGSDKDIPSALAAT